MIKKHALVVVVLMLLSVAGPASGAGAEPSSAFLESGHITCADGAATVARVSAVLFQDDFRGADNHWQPVVNFENLLTFTHTDLDGVSALVITKAAAKPTDTAFELTSLPFAVTPGAAFTYTIAARGDTDMSRARGHQTLYHNRIQWHDRERQVIRETPYAFKTVPSRIIATAITGTVPENAAFAVVRIGADSPNITVDSHLALTSVTFESLPPDSPFHPEGFFVSRPLPLAAGAVTLNWEADTPAGAAISFQVATAPDDEGSPGPWSEWSTPAITAPDTRLPDFPPNHRWLRYRARLQATRDLAPVLKAVTVNGHLDQNWSGQDITPPKVVRLTTARPSDPAAPVAFRITDDTGVDWKHLRLHHHGHDALAHCRRDGEIITFTPPTPLTPPGFDIHIRHWPCTNYRNALSFSAPPDAPEAIRVSREQGETDTAFSLTSPPCPVVPRQSYTFRCDTRHALDLAAPNSTGDGAAGQITWTDATGQRLEPAVPIFLNDANGAWKTVTVTATAPANASAATVSFGFDHPNLANNDYFDLRHVLLDGPRATPAAPLAPNLHAFQITAADLAGNHDNTELYVLVDDPPTKNVVTLRDDGFVLVDGQPFFPIGAYAVSKREANNHNFDQAFADLKKAGFNFAHTYQSTRNENFREFLDAAARHGFKLWIASGAGANATHVGNYLRTVAREYKHPALLAWYLADDTSAHVSPEALTTLHQAIRDLDPFHLTVQADGVGSPENSNYRPYVQATDAFLPEIYPVRDEGSDGPPKVISDMRLIHADLAAHGHPVKSIWAIIQYFQGWSSWKRFPTFAELRAMSFLAVIHGAHGITWYTYGGFNNNRGLTDTPETWNNISTVANQLKQLSPALLERTPPQLEPAAILHGPDLDARGHHAISALLKIHQQDAYLITANSTRNTVQAQFSLPADIAGKTTARVLFENRSVQLQNQRLTDDFKPYDVHVYHFHEH